MAYIDIGWLCSLLFLVLLRRENARRQTGQRDEVIEGVHNPNVRAENGTYTSIEEAKMDKGDDWSGFTYTT